MPFDTHGRTLSFAEAYAIIGGLSNPSKMPWYAWSISAKHCITGSKLREVAGSTCSHCYACKGFYPLPIVQDAMERRRQALIHMTTAHRSSPPSVGHTRLNRTSAGHKRNGPSCLIH